MFTFIEVFSIHFLRVIFVSFWCQGDASLVVTFSLFVCSEIVKIAREVCFTKFWLKLCKTYIN